MTVDVKCSASAGTVLKALAEPLRWRIVELLAHEELCVCHIVDELGVRQPLVSHHLKVLREAGLVESERQGYWTWYRLSPEVLAGLAGTIAGIADQAANASGRRGPGCASPAESHEAP